VVAQAYTGTTNQHSEKQARQVRRRGSERAAPAFWHAFWCCSSWTDAAECSERGAEGVAIAAPVVLVHVYIAIPH
jgi:hypothetical protein